MKQVENNVSFSENNIYSMDEFFVMEVIVE